MFERATTTLDQPIGDALPRPLAAYYDAIDGDRADEAAGAFTPDGIYAVALAGAEETGPRAVTVGSAALAERFRARGPQPWRHAPRLCVADGACVLVEGVLLSATGLAISTFVASARIGVDGLLERYLAFSCPGARDQIPTDVAPSTVPADAAAVVGDYFAALDAGRFPEAAGYFSDDVVYSHPPYKHTGITEPGRVEFRGRPALEAAFHARGRTTFDHSVVASIQRGPHCLFEGAVTNLPDGRGGSFVSSLSLAADGTIRRYVSFYCEPAVPWR